MFSGYKQEMLPFFDVLGVQAAWKKASRTVKPAIAKKGMDQFKRSYALRYKAINLLGERYNFYLKILEREPEIMEAYGEQIGSAYLNDRVVYAIHHCISKGDELSSRLDSLIADFPSQLSELNDYISTEPPATDCERTGVCLCEGSNKPYMWGCMPSDYSRLMEDDAAYQKRMHKHMEEVGKDIFKSLESLAEQES